MQSLHYSSPESIPSSRGNEANLKPLSDGGYYGFLKNVRLMLPAGQQMMKTQRSCTVGRNSKQPTKAGGGNCRDGGNV